jgi:hypothetical protein
MEGNGFPGLDRSYSSELGRLSVSEGEPVGVPNIYCNGYQQSAHSVTEDKFDRC